MTSKIIARNRRAKKLRFKSIDLSTNRLTIFRSSQHIYAQIFSIDEMLPAVGQGIIAAQCRKKDSLYTFGWWYFDFFIWRIKFIL